MRFTVLGYADIFAFRQKQEDRWVALLNALSSILSPGLSIADISAPWSERRSKWEVFVSGSKDLHENHRHSKLATRHVYISRYVLCTENVKNLLNLLPCKNKVSLVIFSRASVCQIY